MFAKTKHDLLEAREGGGGIHRVTSMYTSQIRGLLSGPCKAEVVQQMSNTYRLDCKKRYELSGVHKVWIGVLKPVYAKFVNSYRFLYQETSKYEK